MGFCKHDFISNPLFMNKSPSAERLFLDSVFDSDNWDELLEISTDISSVSIDLKNDFHLFWVEKGHRIRERVNNDRKLLDLLRKFLPPYDGCGLFLFRGENIDRFNDFRIGFCWTQNQQKASQFARGLNACGKGGVLLKAWVPASSIIAGVHPHSEYLGEYEITVDSTGIEQLEILEQYPPSH